MTWGLSYGVRNGREAFRVYSHHRNEGWVRYLLAWAVEHVLGDSFIANVLRLTRTKSIDEFYSLTAEARAFSRHMNQKVNIVLVQLIAHGV